MPEIFRIIRSIVPRMRKANTNECVYCIYLPIFASDMSLYYLSMQKYGTPHVSTKRWGMKISTNYLFYISNQLFVSFQINEEISYLKYHLHLNPLMSDTTTRSGTAAGVTASTWCRAPPPSPASAAGLWRTDPRRSRPRPRTARTRGRGGRRLRMGTRRPRTERTKLSIRCVPGIAVNEGTHEALLSRRRPLKTH